MGEDEVETAWESDVCVNGEEHDPDPRTMKPVENEWIVDIWCRRCGKAGSVAIEPGEILWE